MNKKEASARIKINKFLEESGWLSWLDEFITLNWVKIKRDVEKSMFLRLSPEFLLQN
jgi:hypothetical protein